MNKRKECLKYMLNLIIIQINCFHNATTTKKLFFFLLILLFVFFKMVESKN